MRIAVVALGSVTNTSSRKKRPFLAANVTLTSPVAVMVAVYSVNAPFFIVTVAGEIVPLDTDRLSVVLSASASQVPAKKVSVAVPETVNSGVVALPLTLPVPNFAH